MRGERLAPPIGTFQALSTGSIPVARFALSLGLRTRPALSLGPRGNPLVTREATTGIGPDRRRAIELPDGSMRSFLEGGDDVVLRGASGLGEASGTVEPARC
jgi:hypothetical protein